MDEQKITKILEKIQSGQLDIQTALIELKKYPFEEVDGIANIDHHRTLRKGHPEIIFGEGKQVDQIVTIARRMAKQNDKVIVTRVDSAKAESIQKIMPEFLYHPVAHLLVFDQSQHSNKHPGIMVLSAGTADIPVAEEAAMIAELMNNEVDRLYDVGVAGLQRLLSQMERLMKARVIIVAAGMDGALPSVVGGLVSAPVIAVPTSIGYGASFNGIAALLTMLNSCSEGLCVVNIDNGFGAGYLASIINQLGK